MLEKYISILRPKVLELLKDNLHKVAKYLKKYIFNKKRDNEKG